MSRIDTAKDAVREIKAQRGRAATIGDLEKRIINLERIARLRED